MLLFNRFNCTFTCETAILYKTTVKKGNIMISILNRIIKLMFTRPTNVMRSSGVINAGEIARKDAFAQFTGMPGSNGAISPIFQRHHHF